MEKNGQTFAGALDILTKKGKTNWELAKIVVNSIYGRTNPEWKTVADPDDPYSWGNQSLFVTEPASWVIRFPDRKPLPGEDPWYLLTLDVANTTPRK
jgi:hypothetical protein